MSVASEKLYDEFLENYGLEKGFYYHTIEMLDHPFEKIEKVQAIRIGETLVPLTPAVSNSVKFNVQLNIAPINAEKEIKKYIGSYKGLNLDYDDANLFCFTAEEAVLRNLLWPFHLLTHNSDLTEKDFFPIANMMEGVVCDVQDALFEFLQAVLGSTDRIDAKRDRKIDDMNRQTDTWAANAPIEVRGTIRRYGNHIDVSATARSTVTSGMVNADYQVHNLLANQSANREKAAAHTSYMDVLEKKLLTIISSYKTLWYDCLKNLGAVIGTNVLRDSICGDNIAYRPDKEENIKEIVKNAQGEISYAHLKKLIEFYGHDCDELFGKRVALRIINSAIIDKKVDVDNFYYDFYAYFYDVEHPLQHEPFFKRFREMNQESTRSLCKRSLEEFPDFFKAENCDKVLTSATEIIEVLVGVTEKQKNRLLDDNSSIFYEFLGDTERSEFYKNGAPRFEY